MLRLPTARSGSRSSIPYDPHDRTHDWRPIVRETMP